MSESKRKFIIDTDCGIDDAIALLFALNHKDRINIMSITCCFGNATIDHVVDNVKRVLTVCDSKNIPIHRGSYSPLVKRNVTETAHGSDGLGGCGARYPTSDICVNPVPAAMNMIESVKKYPQEITLIALGPLTNLALAHRLDKDFFKNLKSIVIMGGNYKGIGNITPVAEFNFHTDPDAANIVLTEAETTITLVPWETTLDHGIPWDLYKELLETKTKKGEFFKQITKLHAELEYEAYIDCDFLAAVVALYPEAIKSSESHFSAVEIDGKLAQGLTVLLRESSINEAQQKIEIVTSMHDEILTKLRKKMLIE